MTLNVEHVNLGKQFRLVHRGGDKFIFQWMSGMESWVVEGGGQNWVDDKKVVEWRRSSSVEFSRYHRGWPTKLK